MGILQRQNTLPSGIESNNLITLTYTHDWSRTVYGNVKEEIP